MFFFFQVRFIETKSGTDAVTAALTLTTEINAVLGVLARLYFLRRPVLPARTAVAWRPNYPRNVPEALIVE